jgi:acyl-CoA thioesterase FadM
VQQIYEKEALVAPSACDYDGLLGYPGTFALFMDLATEHALHLGVGFAAMRERDCFWLTVKTKIVFHDRPAISDAVRLVTWPEKPGPLRFNRSYELRRGEALLISGRTEWAVLNTATGTLVPSADIMPAGLAYEHGSAVSESYARIPDRFADADAFAEYTVRSADIDIGGHMNNAAYPRALFAAFPSAALKARNIRSVDLLFRAPCFEGDLLTLYKKEGEGALDLRMARGEETVLLARIAE